MKMPVIKYILNEPEVFKKKILLPILHADKKQIMFSMPKTIVINPGESKIVDLKIKIIFPPSINSVSNIIGRFGIHRYTRKSFDIEIRQADSFLLRDSNMQVNIKNNSQKTCNPTRKNISYLTLLSKKI